GGGGRRSTPDLRHWRGGPKFFGDSRRQYGGRPPPSTTFLF
ncbi:hypothetical protein A2U01_0063548, partial [Trifolium medium]|nr:hypothetical protein [Trifolium medium]